MWYRVVRDGAGKIIETESFRKRPWKGPAVDYELVEITDKATLEELQYPVDENGDERLSWDTQQKRVVVDKPLTDAIRRR